ncbi:DUF4174 domain-containing protein [Vannielia sp.]|uniref:DUF4174 domain-containing protein n=1 Tax=Vannielia sp. TaxID=2813045 RepID=UPI00261EA827|nr:DUF4174 domain-containing protein [Vannielia sp.]MDF1871443.1 DUF4174 domain-containing protein [Vannielia sp.]
MRLISFIFLASLAMPAMAQETGVVAVSPGAEDDAIAAEAGEAVRDANALAVLDASETDLAEFLWLRRPVVVFADTPADPRFAEQLELLAARTDALLDRDVVIITDADPAANSAIRTKLRPRGFMLVLIGKDGQVKLRKPFPWDVREITRSIDKWPLRRDELRQR